MTLLFQPLRFWAPSIGSGNPQYNVALPSSMRNSVASFSSRNVPSTNSLEAHRAATFAHSERDRKAAEMLKFQRLQVMQLHHCHSRLQEQEQVQQQQQLLRVDALQRQQQHQQAQQMQQGQTHGPQQQRNEGTQAAQGFANAPPYTFVQVLDPRHDALSLTLTRIAAWSAHSVPSEPTLAVACISYPHQLFGTCTRPRIPQRRGGSRHRSRYSAVLHIRRLDCRTVCHDSALYQRERIGRSFLRRDDLFALRFRICCGNECL